MDNERKIRFLYPPFILIFSVFFGIYSYKPEIITNVLSSTENENIIAKAALVLVGGSIAVVVLGFLISIITMNVLRLGFRLLGKRHYMAVDSLSERSYKHLKKALISKNNSWNQSDYKYAAIFYENTIVPQRVQGWLIRRWNSFNISASSLTALLLSIPVLVSCKGFQITIEWILFILIIGTFLVLNGVNSWRETLEMTEFCHKCDFEKVNKEISGS